MYVADGHLGGGDGDMELSHTIAQHGNLGLISAEEMLAVQKLLNN